MTKTTFGDMSGGRDNNFDFLRLLFAALVVFSHSFAIRYGDTYAAYDPLCHLTHGQSAFGGLSVDCFFLISGFLITKSWMSSRGTGDYARKRCLRILPALIVVVLFCMFIIGPLATLDLGAYFHNPATYKYAGFLFTKNLHLTDRLLGVFTHNPLPFRVDGSLWTVRVEMLCYGMVAVLGLIGLYRRALPLSLLTLAAWLVSIVQSRHPEANGGEGVFHVVLYFLFGMSFFLNRNRIPYSAGLLLVALVGLVVSDLIGVLGVLSPFLVGYVLYYVAFSPKVRLHHFGKYGDFSYGLYLYAFPITQLLMEKFGTHLTPLTLFLAAFAASMVCAFASWHLIEKPFLRMKRRPIPVLAAPEASVAAVPVGAGAP